MAYLCESCDATFPKTPKGKQEWLLHRAEHKQASLGKVPESATGQEIKKSMSAQEIKQMKAEENEGRKAKPPKLGYTWEGECTECFGMLESLLIEAGQPKGKAVTVAFCPKCKKEIAHRQVDKL
jgi:hypothetical protein